MEGKVLVLLVTTIILLFAVMILSAHAAVLAARDESKKAHQYTTYSALVTGIAVLILGALLGLGLYGGGRARTRVASMLA